MIASTGTRWVLTVLFVALAGYGLWRAARPHDPTRSGIGSPSRAVHFVHAVMAAVMAAMGWAWGARLPAWPQIVFFGVAALWFLVGMLRPGTARSVGDRLSDFPHTVMAGTMAWMPAVMKGPMSTTAHGTAGAGMADMPGMSTAGSASGMPSMALSGGLRLAAGLLAGYFLLLAVWWLVRVLPPVRVDRNGHGHDAADLGCHAGMALGMAVMLVAMT